MRLLSLSAHILLTALQFIIYYGVHSLQLVQILTPDYVRFGDPLWLNCSSDLQYHQIYSIKWFKDNQEFYRFITIDEMPKTFYNTTGIYPDWTKSHFGNVYLSKTDYKTEGKFRCEVTAGNDFKTVQEIKFIKVYFIPKDPNPIIVGKKSQYRKNELVNLTCTSPMSLPGAQLTVSINGNSIPSNTNYHQRMYYSKYENNLSATSVNIQFPSSWLNKRKSFECTSAIIHKFNKSSQINLVTRPKDLQAIQLINGDHIFYTEGDNQTDELLPTILGLKSSYNVGDIVNITCVSARYKPVPELIWFIDTQEVDVKFLSHYQPTYDSDGYAVTTLGLLYTIQMPTANNSKNKSTVSLKCVQTLCDVITVGEESAIITNAVETISDNSVGAVKSFMDSTGCKIHVSSILLTFVALITSFVYYFQHKHNLMQQ